MKKILIFLHLTYAGTRAEDDVLQHVENAYLSVVQQLSAAGKKWPSAGANQQAAAGSPSEDCRL